MARTVFANSRNFSHKGSGDKSINSAPDVCKTPVGSSTPPIPYPAISQAASAGGYTASVFVDGNPTAIASSTHTSCSGDEAGSAKGLVSGTTSDKTEFASYSFDVKSEGEGVVRHMDMTTMNNSNTVGSVIGTSTSAEKIEDEATVTHLIHMHLDADRDGVVDGDRSGLNNWAWGAGKKGAIILCNNDDDDGSGATDNSDDTINGASDVDKIAPLVFRVEGGTSAPSSYSAYLEVSATMESNIRIFDARAAGAKEIIGPSTSNRYDFPDLNFTELAFGMEATRYAGTGFDGEITLTFTVLDGALEAYRETAKVRVAPWLMPSHKEAAETVYVVNDSYNARFVAELGVLVAAAGASLEIYSEKNDPWMQDCMEFGYANLPKTGFRSVMRAPRDRPLSKFPKTLLKKDLGYYEAGALAESTLNSTGNLEVTPPATSAAGNHYPYGRIYFGANTRPKMQPISSELRDFLYGQVAQTPIAVDTSWLTVAHVDEIISFVPAPGPLGFKMLMASPRKAYAILNNSRRVHSKAKMLSGRRVVDFHAQQWRDVDTTVDDFLSLGLPTLGHTKDALRLFNKDIDARLDLIKEQFERAIGIDAARDVIEVPILFMPSGPGSKEADAITAGMVNMLVLNQHCIVPKPFGPMVGTLDLFEQDLRAQLESLGLTVNFLDCWNEYHVWLGEVHCGTNTLRSYVPSKWWEFEP